MGSILKKFQSLSIKDLQKVPDIGPKVAQSIFDWFRDKKNEALMESLEKSGILIEKESRSAKGQSLAGKVFVLTGGLEAMSRDGAKEKIRELGGDASESVTKKTTYLVAGTDPGSKLEKARKIGVEVIGEAELLKLIGH